MNRDIYTAQLHDRAFGPAVERIADLRLVGGEPEPVIHRYVERDGQRWVKVYRLESWIKTYDITPGSRNDDSLAPSATPGTVSYAYVLSHEGPDSGKPSLDNPDQKEKS